MTPDDLARILDELGQRLGPTGQAAFQTVITQKVNEAQAWLGFYNAATTIVLVLMAILFFGGIAVAVIDRHSGDLADFAGLIVVFEVALGLLFAFFQYQLIATGLQAQNPTYYALREIITAIKP